MSNEPVPFQPERILQVLHRHGVAYVLVGGYAARMHGATRPTSDIDVTPSTTQENLARVTAALQDLGAGIRVDELPQALPFSTDATALANMTGLNLRTPYGDVDLTFSPSGTDGYEDLIRDASPRQIGQVTVQLASLADIIRSKEAAARAKDYIALPELLRLAGRASTAKPSEPPVTAAGSPAERVAQLRELVDQAKTQRARRAPDQSSATGRPASPDRDHPHRPEAKDPSIDR